MTSHQWFAFVILPVVVAGLGWLAAFVQIRAIRRADARDAAQPPPSSPTQAH